MAEGKNAESLYTYMPSVLQTDLEKIWAEFVGQQITRDEFTEQYQQIFKDYADGKYN